MRNPLAGKKAKILYRNPDKSTVLQVEDEHDEILVTVAEDGSMSEHRVFGLAGVGAALKAASPFDKIRVPNDAGQKHWTRLEPEPEPVAVVEPEPVAEEPAPEPEPELPPVADHVAEAARRLSIQIWSGVSVPRAQLAPANDQALAHAVAMEWLAVAGDLIVRGGVDPRQVTVTRIPNF